MNDEAKIMRIRHIYRTMILRGGVRIPRRYAELLVGPDCAYRLYDTNAGKEGTRKRSLKKHGTRRKSRPGSR